MKSFDIDCQQRGREQGINNAAVASDVQIH